MATELGVKNAALALIGEPALATTTDDVYARYVLDDAWTDAIVFMLRQAPWRFALKTETVTGVTSALIPGYTHSFTKPTTWLRTHAVFTLSTARECPFDFREQGAKWYANISSLTARHVSTDGNVVATWTEQFAKALAAYLAFIMCDKISGDPSRTSQMRAAFEEFLTTAIEADAVPENPWLPYQMDGTLLSGCNYLLEQGLWKFAIVTATLTPNVATPSAGYDYAFDKPAAWIRTVQVGRTFGAGQIDIDYRDEGNDFHANHTPIVVRYLSSTLGRDPTAWSDAFQHALLAYLALLRATAQPDTPGAVLQARQMAFERSFDNARSKDDMRERPRVIPASRLTSARAGGSTNYRREQGW